MKKIEVFPKFSLSKESTSIHKQKNPNIIGVYNYKDFLIKVFEKNGLKSLSIDQSAENKIDDDELENIAIHFIGLNYKVKTNCIIEEIRDDNN